MGLVYYSISSAMSDEERESIRAQLLGNFNEPVAPIATQLAVLIGKVARLDCPRNWPGLIPTLLEAVKTPDKLAQQRALLTLHHVTKTLAAKRLATDRKLFQEVRSAHYFIQSCWKISREYSSIIKFLLTNRTREKYWLEDSVWENQNLTTVYTKMQ